MPFSVASMTSSDGAVTGQVIVDARDVSSVSEKDGWIEGELAKQGERKGTNYRNREHPPM